MKLIQSLGILALVLSASVARAESPLIDGSDNIREGDRIFAADLQTFGVDVQLQRTLGDIEKGSVSIDLTKKEVTLTLLARSSCPQGALCIMEMTRAPFTVTLPLISQGEGDCHSKHYIAKKDQRMIDGALQTLDIYDYSNTNCAHADTELTYETESTGRHMMKTHSSFTAERLYERQY